MKIENHLKDMPTFETERLQLRKVTRHDLDDVFEFSSDFEVAQRMTWEKNDSKEETLSNFLQPTVDGYKDGQSGVWAIVYKESEKVIGIRSLVAWSNEHQKAEIGYVLNRKFWGAGVATEALQEILNYGFGVLQLNRIEGGCDLDNIGSEKVMLKAGMTFEGVLRESERIKGEFRDTKIFSILKSEFDSASAHS
ncbi:GNAT family N-acetyltransferase [Planococcus sp. SSTMD024]|uniref:GNAT family N-acetyltransferase n=1 Tax=Planococcus sp. SSTMD024 TaxID=3242163 RepID=UPI00351DE642